MLSRNNKHTSVATVRKTTWILLAVALGALEFFFPRIPLFPWLKPGLANCITLIWIIEYGVTDALLFFLLRSWITGFYFGFSFFTLALSMSGGLLATIAMGLCWTLVGKNRLMGTIGISVIGALMHNCGQLITVYYLMAKNTHLFYQLPVMFVASIVFGSIVGIIVPVLIRLLHHEVLPETVSEYTAHTTLPAATSFHAVICMVILAACAVLTIINSMVILVVCALLASGAAHILFKGTLRRLVQPITKFWMLFVFIACLHLFFSYGTYLPYLPFVTREGVTLTLQQWLRLWTWLELSYVLRYFNFHTVIFNALSRLFPGRHETLYAGILALDFFPEVIHKIQTKTRSSWRTVVRHPLHGSHKALQGIYMTVMSIMTTRNNALPD